MKDQKYTPQGHLMIVRPDSNGMEKLKDMLMVCNGCGAIIMDEDRTLHNKYHQNLASLWDNK